MRQLAEHRFLMIAALTQGLQAWAALCPSGVSLWPTKNRAEGLAWTSWERGYEIIIKAAVP